MRKTLLFFILGFVWLLAVPLLAQEKPGTVAGVWHVKLKAGMRQQFEQANKRHMEWHRQQKDTWAENVWEIVSGDQVGQYGYGTFNHHWKDFDSHAKFDEADMADYYANVAPYVESEAGGFYLYHPEMSRPMGGDAPLSEVVEYHLNMTGESDFLMAVRKIHEAIQKTNYPVYYHLYELYNGGEHPTYVFVFPHKNWADFEPPEQTFLAMLEKAYGRDEAESVLKLFDKSVHGLRSQIIAYRPDLSYLPPPAK
jgi:hypothetical protein